MEGCKRPDYQTPDSGMEAGSRGPAGLRYGGSKIENRKWRDGRRWDGLEEAEVALGGGDGDDAVWAVVVLLVDLAGDGVGFHLVWGVAGEEGEEVFWGGAAVQPLVPVGGGEDDGHAVDDAGDDAVGRGADDGEVMGVCPGLPESGEGHEAVVLEVEVPGLAVGADVF